jgi:predicted MPP superfamily phosphohydrolase
MLTPMPLLRPLIFATIGFVFLIGVIALSTRFLLPHWWRVRGVRWALAGLAAAAVIGLGIWASGGIVHSRAVVTTGVHALWVLLAFVLPLTVAVVAAGIAWRLASLVFLRTKADAPAKDDGKSKITRRAVIQWGTAAIPASAIAASTTGLVSAASEPLTSTFTMRFPSLHPDLEGLRILHLTDLHLGPYRKVEDLEWVLARATAGTKPDLIVFTGDIADELPMLAPSLQLAADQKPRFGVFASVGNHEYFRNIRLVRKIFDVGPVPLLMERGQSIDIGAAKLYISGADDPVRLSGDIGAFMERTIDAALDGAPSDAFHLMLSHRPDGFVASAARGVDLTLSGHTHGTQVGLFGRSAFEPLFPKKFLRGEYTRGKSQLYTSAGFGHWFPFRLNCPPEAPTIVLARA